MSEGFGSIDVGQHEPLSPLTSIREVDSCFADTVLNEEGYLVECCDERC